MVNIEWYDELELSIYFPLLQSNFDKRGTEFGDWTPTDWKESPAFLQNIKDPNFRKFGADLHVLWKVLGRKMHENITVSLTKRVSQR